MDVTRLDMADGSADSLLDKATLDTLLNLDDGGRAGRAMAAEAARVVRRPRQKHLAQRPARRAVKSAPPLLSAACCPLPPAPL